MADMPELWQLERECFEIPRRSSRRSLRRSLASGHQIVRVARRGPGWPILASAVLMRYVRTWRLYSMAVAPRARGLGLGKMLVADAAGMAAAAGADRLSLEADARDGKLVRWYEGQGFAVVSRLDDYYGPDRDALRMLRAIARTGDTRPRGGP